MDDLKSLKEFIKTAKNLNFINACITTLNDFKLGYLEKGLQQNIINFSILADKTDSEMEEIIDIAGRTFTGSWWANIAGGKINFIEDNESNRKIALQMYEKISNFTYEDIIYLTLKEWISINKKRKIFKFKITNVDDFFKKKEFDEIAFILWYMNFFVILLACHKEPKGMRKILCLKKSLLGKWSKYQIQFK